MEVFTVGVGTEPTVHGYGAPAPLAEATTGDPAPLAAALLAAAEHDTPLLIHPAWGDAAVAHALATARHALGRARVAAWETSLPPLAAAVLAALAAAVARAATAPGQLVAALPALEAELAVGAWLPSVARLRRPEPSTGQRMRSRVPGRSWGVRLQPEPAVTPLPSPAALELGLEGFVAGPSAIAVAGPEDPAAAIADALGEDVTRVPADPAAPDWWRARRAVELVAYPVDVPRLAERVLPGAAVACPWCGEPVAWHPCPICGHDRNAAPPPAPGGTGAPTELAEVAA